MTIPMCGCGFPKYDCHCSELTKMTPKEQRLWWVAREGYRDAFPDKLSR